MALRIINSDIIASGDAITSSLPYADYDQILVREGVLVSSAAASALNGSALTNLNVIVDGDVIAAEYGIRLSDAGAASSGDTTFTVSVSDTGSVRSSISYNAIALTSPSSGYDLYATVNNHGLVESTGGAAISIALGYITTILNTGAIQSIGSAPFSAANALIVTDRSFTLDNTGVISLSNYDPEADVSTIQNAAQYAAIYTDTTSGTLAPEFNLTNSGSILAPAVAIVSVDKSDDIANSGEISGDIWLHDLSDTLTNTGEIRGAVNLGSGSDVFSNFGDVEGDVDFEDGEDSFLNAGVLLGDIQAYGSQFNAEMNVGSLLDGGIDTSNATLSLISNGGAITGDVEIGDGTVANSGDILGQILLAAGSAYSAVENAGSIGGVDAQSDQTEITNTGDVWGDISSDVDELVFINSGDVYGLVLTTASSFALYENTGKIVGSILHEGVGATIANAGRIVGNVELGDGDDVFDGFGGTVLGLIEAGAGDDIIRSGYGDNSIDGGAGADLINGGLGEDTLTYSGSNAGVTLDFRTGVGYGIGGDGTGDTVLNVEHIVGSNFADAFKGDINANTLRGGGGNDDLRGFGGADTLDGGSGHDVLFGFADNDILDGGAGADIMVGGDGADVFRFDDGDTGRGADSDIIKDFTADDILDLSAIDAITGGGDDAFTLLSFGAAFTGAGGEARLIGSAGNWTLQYDADGDLVPDGAIIFQSTYMPTADDIVL